MNHIKLKLNKIKLNTLFSDENNDNPNLRQIVKDTGFNPPLVNNNFQQRPNNSARQNNFPPQGQNNSQRQQQPFVSGLYSIDLNS
jgi:hypothetical protein